MLVKMLVAGQPTQLTVHVPSSRFPTLDRATAAATIARRDMLISVQRSRLRCGYPALPALELHKLVEVDAVFCCDSCHREGRPPLQLRAVAPRIQPGLEGTRTR